jgi:hypothetical protein
MRTQLIGWAGPGGVLCCLMPWAGKPQTIPDDRGSDNTSGSSSHLLPSLWESEQQKQKNRQRQDSNLRGQCPIDFESIALTARPRCESQQWFYVHIANSARGTQHTRHETDALDADGCFRPEWGVLMFEQLRALA